MTKILGGRRILITRTRTQASLLVQSLEALGAEPIVIPTIAIEPPLSLDPLDHALQTLDHFDWLLFTSANAVEAVASRARRLNIVPSPKRIAAIGQATARALQAASFTPSLAPLLVPSSAVAESLAEALLPLLSRSPPATIALFRAEAARDLLPQALIAAGARLQVVPVYRTVQPAGSAEALTACLCSPTELPDAITFTSSSTATNLVALLRTAGLELPSGIRRISIGPITTATLRDLGLPPHAEARDATIPSMVEAIIQSLH